MRLPNRKALSREQEDIVLDAPMDAPVLITGAPGTGKTVIAIYRLNALHARSERDSAVKPPSLIMHSRVLCRYTENAVDDLGVSSDTVCTWHSWVNSWWRRSCKKSPPSLAPFQYDFDTMVDTALEGPRSFSWGHIVIDEGQDFPPDFYHLMYSIRRQIIRQGSSLAPSLTVLADDNQRMNEKENSSIDSIVKELGIDTEQQFRLQKNFRNTREIAKFSAVFYTGLATGIADIPEGNVGDLPVLLQAKTFDDEMDIIARHAKNYGRHNIGVFASTNAIRARMVKALESRFEDTAIAVHTYRSGKSKSGGTGVDHLNFDKPSIVTVVNHQSCKGLEFDAVFIPQLQTHRVDAADETFFKMKFYVMCSRARTHLTLSYSGCNADSLPGVISLLPKSEEGLYRWKTS